MDTACPGCGLILPLIDEPLDERVNATVACRNLCHQLAFYTLGRGDTFFIHQVLVDAYGAQHCNSGAPTIGLAFALIGLCLLLEHDYTGKDVQNAHIRLAKKTKVWPLFSIPEDRGAMTVADVWAAAEGDARDAAMIRWAQSVWDAYADEQEHVRNTLRQCGEI